MEKILITGASCGIGEELTRNLANKSKKLFLPVSLAINIISLYRL